MISQSTAKDLEILEDLPSKIPEPAFASKKPLWTKEESHPRIKEADLSGKRYQYSKNGKIFAFERTRYITWHKDHLFYYEEQKDSKFKGYCCFQNLYFAFHKLKSKRFLFYLSNGNEESFFFFETQDFYNSVRKEMQKHSILLNFGQKYTVQSNLGKGSFSQVYLVKDKLTKNCFAAKVVSKLDKNKAPTKNLVQEERKILQSIDSEFVYHFYEFYEDSESYVIILEHLTGKDLMTLFKEGTEFALVDIVYIFRSILQGLTDCHKVNIYHRDLKPQNILIDMTTLKPKLIDFGLSLLIDSNTELKSFKRCGTMGYMAPEVIANTADIRKPYNEKCDLFSMGIIVHMILMGKNPLKGKCYEETYTNNKLCDIVLDKEKIVSKYGEDAYIFLSCLLEKNPKKRVSAQDALHCNFLKVGKSSEHLHYKEESAETADEVKLHVKKSQTEAQL